MSILFAILLISVLPIYAEESVQEQHYPLVEVDWLDAHRADGDIVILDIRGEDIYKKGHIPNSIAIELGVWRTSANGVVGMLPDTQYMQSLIRTLGIKKESKIVIVFSANGNADLGDATRIYWTLALSRLSNIYILNGGYEAWEKQAFSTTKQHTAHSKSNYVLNSYDEKYLEDYESTRLAIENPNVILVDARTPEYYYGYASSRVASKSGTIKSAINISYLSFIASNGKLKPKQELENIAKKHALSKNKQIITFCNTGRVSTVDWFVLSELLGYRTSMYDGSFVEWSNHYDAPVDNK